jgi:hypothetical protein
VKSRVASRARLRDDRAGDPLDGLVNLFDLGLVLALAFLLVAINSLGSDSVKPTPSDENQITVDPDQQVGTVPQTSGQQVIGTGQEVGKVYRLDDGRLVYVAPKSP